MDVVCITIGSEGPFSGPNLERRKPLIDKVLKLVRATGWAETHFVDLSPQLIVADSLDPRFDAFIEVRFEAGWQPPSRAVSSAQSQQIKNMLDSNNGHNFRYGVQVNFIRGGGSPLHPDAPRVKMPDE